MKLSVGIDLFYESMEGVLSQKTILWYKNRLPSLINYFDDPDIDQITVYNLRKWRAYLSKKTSRYNNHPFRPALEGGLSPFTIHQYIRAARKLFRWFKDEKITAENIAERLELPDLPEYEPKGIHTADRDKMLAACKNSPRDYAIILFLSDTACRVGGLSHLKLNDLDLQNSKAIVREKGRNGRLKKRTVFFGDVTKAALIEYLEDRPNAKCDYVFVGYSQGKLGRLHENGVYEMLERTALRAGVTTNYNPHAFRHGSIKAMLVNGLSLPEVSQIAGHSTTKVTGDIYGRFDENHLAERHKLFSWIKPID